MAAPERGEPGAKAATQAMVEMVDGQTLRCELDGEQTYDRCVAVCDLEGRDVAAELARDCPAFSGGRYVELEQTAAADGAEIKEAYRLPGYCR